MKRPAFFSWILLAAAVLAAAACSTTGPAKTTSNTNAPAKDPNARPAVLVELFTSEGCVNCPPADQFLAQLEKDQPIAGADVVTLGYHVDYFDDRGWKDEFSSKDFTIRQSLYAPRLGVPQVYTPQMVVNGQTQFVGADQARAAQAVTAAAAAAKYATYIRTSGNIAEVTVRGLPAHTQATAVAVAVEDGLENQVKAGGNNGKTLRHSSVVRKLVGFARVPPETNDITATVELPADPAWKQENVRYVFFIQEEATGRIIASGRITK